MELDGPFSTRKVELIACGDIIMIISVIIAIYTACVEKKENLN